MAIDLGAPLRSIAGTTPAANRLWADLAARAAEDHGQPGVYAALAAHLTMHPASPVDGIWSTLARRTDPAAYHPLAIQGVVEETVTEDGTTYTVLRSPAGRYLRLTPAERELWAAMDGSRSVADLATMGFLRFRQLLPVDGLVRSLRQDGFLVDSPVGLYRGMQGRLEARTVQGWGRRLVGALRSYTLPVGGVDELAGALYRWGGWALFTWPAAVLIGLTIAAGLACFARLSPQWAGDGATTIGVGTVGLSLLGLWAALLVSFVLHELAHALAVKHFGRRVVRAGVMMYFGMPAAFVDTSDIWLAGRRARVITSLAGPICDALLGSLAAIAATFLLPGSAGSAAYTLAVASYLAGLCNLNPLLELDGYYMLSDWLGLPNLRQRALAFIRGPLWQKLRAAPGPERGALLARLSREERIFTLYGALAALYTALAIALALVFWRVQLAGTVAALWAAGPGGQALAVLIVLGVVVPVGLGLLVAAWGLLQAAAAWVGRQGLSRSPTIVAGALALLAVAFATLPLRYGSALDSSLLAPLLWLAALAAQLALHADYRGAAVARSLDCFLVVTGIEVIAQLGFRLLPGQAPLWSAMENLGFALLLFAGLVALLDIDLRQSPPGELAGSALLMALAFLAGGLTIGLFQAARPGEPFLLSVVNAAPVYTSAMALALLLPQVAGLHESRLLASWLLLWVGIAAQTPAYVLELLPAWRGSAVAHAAVVLAAGLWAAAWCSHLVVLRQGVSRSLSWPMEPARGEAARLQRAFRHTYAGLYWMLRQHHGTRRARALDDRMDVLAATANWQITLDRDEARIGAELAGAPIDTQGARYAEVLRYAVATIEGLAGATFARRAIQVAYDALPWPEREAADRRCFPNTPWARELSRAFGDARAARIRLLREVERFAGCDDAELAALATALVPRRAAAGTLVLGAGVCPPGLWIVEAGEVTARDGTRVVEELHRAECFGATGLDTEQPSSLDYRASVDSDLLFLSLDELRQLAREAAPHAADGLALAHTVRSLERAPFFHDLPREALRALARTAEHVHLPARSVLIRQGHPSGRIFVIVAGSAAVLRRDETGATAVVARLGPAELFGELELLRGTPPMASVVATTPVELLVLPHQTVADLLRSGGAARGLERIGTARIRELQPSP
ncbi:MAG: cyclic nucleotide-binding domain-containing protein [Chloroflexi bacterium OHK40]